MNYYHFIDSFISYYRIFIARVNGSVLNLRGANVGKKFNLGRSSVIHKPWCLTLGDRVTFESDVFIKIVSDEASCSIGNFVFLGKGVELNIQHNLKIGSHVLLAPGVFITDHNHQTKPLLRINQQVCLSKGVIIEDDVWIGANAVILPGVKIGYGAVIGAGAIVTTDVKKMTIVAGVPAKLIRNR